MTLLRHRDPRPPRQVVGDFENVSVMSDTVLCPGHATDTEGGLIVSKRVRLICPSQSKKPFAPSFFSNASICLLEFQRRRVTLL